MKLVARSNEEVLESNENSSVEKQNSEYFRDKRARELLFWWEACENLFTDIHVSILYKHPRGFHGRLYIGSGQIRPPTCSCARSQADPTKEGSFLALSFTESKFQHGINYSFEIKPSHPVFLIADT